MRMPKVAPAERSAFGTFYPITTRWSDNDVYGHVNNVVFYSWFDSAANRYMIEQGGLDIERSQAIGLVVESHCHYHAPVAYPEVIEAGVRVAKLSERSVGWAIGIFRAGEQQAAAHGEFVHVFVDRASRRPVAIPEPLRRALVKIG
jgi:acyl-CoA thioester hydrolase